MPVVAANSVAVDTNLMGFGVPSPSSLREDIEGVLAVWALCLLGLIRVGWARGRGPCLWIMLMSELGDSRQGR